MQLVAIICHVGAVIVSCEGSGGERDAVIAGSVVGGVLVIAGTVITIVVCVACCHRRVTSTCSNIT